MEKIVVLILPFITILGAISYQFFRSKMTRPPPNDPVYSTFRVLKLIHVNFFLNLSLILVNIFVTYAILTRIVFNTSSITLLIFYLISLFFVVYGCGIYVTTIVLNCYLKDPITNAELKADHLLHGVISHVLIFSGWILVLFFQALLEVNFASPELSALQTPLLISGVIYGITFAVLQIYNDTYIYQMIVGLITGLAFYFCIIVNNILIIGHPLTSFYFGFIFMCNLILLTHVLYRVATKKKISWNRAKYQC